MTDEKGEKNGSPNIIDKLRTFVWPGRLGTQNQLHCGKNSNGGSKMICGIPIAMRLRGDALQSHSIPGNEDRYVEVRSHFTLSHKDIDELMRGTEVIYTVGRLQYTDANGVHPLRDISL